jgi:hypothetical protein
MTMDGEDRRKSPRKTTLLGAKVVFNAKQSSMNCRIRNLGEDGARLRFDGPPLVPANFELRVEERDQKRHARRVWVRANEMGIAFD